MENKICSYVGCENDVFCSELCRGHYNQKQSGKPLSTLRPYLDGTASRLVAYSDRSGDCWLWTRAKRKGYGVVTHQGRQVLAHRVSYELEHGVRLIPEQVVHHLCHNPACIKPSHLQLVSHHENVSEALMVKALRDALRKLDPNHPLLIS